MRACLSMFKTVRAISPRNAWLPAGRAWGGSRRDRCPARIAKASRRGCRDRSPAWRSPGRVMVKGRGDRVVLLSARSNSMQAILCGGLPGLRRASLRLCVVDDRRAFAPCQPDSRSTLPAAANTVLCVGSADAPWNAMMAIASTHVLRVCPVLRLMAP